jgi:hypothetical protein
MERDTAQRLVFREQREGWEGQGSSCGEDIRTTQSDATLKLNLSSRSNADTSSNTNSPS